MTGGNAFFKTSDQFTLKLADKYDLHPTWWSRHYEYPWALSYAGEGMNVADMGSGWMGRPFKDALADVCAHVYAIDLDWRLYTLDYSDNVTPLAADFTHQIDEIEDGSLDRVFCISVLEDVGERIPQALEEFARVLKPDGLVIITMDVRRDGSRKAGKYPSVKWLEFWSAVIDAGLAPVDTIRNDKTDAVMNYEYNLCCYHAVLRHE